GLDKKNDARIQLTKDISNTKQPLTSLVQATLTDEFNCLVVCIDESNKVLETYGDTSKYLLQKILTSDFTELLPRPLAIAFNTLSAKVMKTNKKASLKAINTQYGKSTIKVNLSISPLSLSKAGPKLLSVIL